RFRSRRWIGLGLLLCAAPAIAVWGMLTNGEYRDVELPVLIAAAVVLLDGKRPFAQVQVTRSGLGRVYASALAALLLIDISMGVARYRVESIGPHQFFGWNESVPVRQRF